MGYSFCGGVLAGKQIGQIVVLAPIKLRDTGQSINAACSVKENRVKSEVVINDDCPSRLVFYISNVFTPDGNGINDVFGVYSNMPADVLSMQGKIFDRWGNLVFESTDHPFTWDGQFRGEMMNPGVYVYTVKVRYVTPNGEREEVFTGDVTLVK